MMHKMSLHLQIWTIKIKITYSLVGGLSVTRKNRQMSRTVAQKWFHKENDTFTKIAYECERFGQSGHTEGGVNMASWKLTKHLESLIKLNSCHNYFNGPNTASFCLFLPFYMKQIKYKFIKALMVCMGLKPGVAGWKA